MQVVKTISFRYDASDELSSLFEDFCLMCNDAIRIAIQYEQEHGSQSVKSRFRLIELAYPRLKEYGLHTHYILSACEVAFASYRNKDRKSVIHLRLPNSRSSTESLEQKSQGELTTTRESDAAFSQSTGSQRRTGRLNEFITRRRGLWSTPKSIGLAS
ncbi:MAG TPA: hypothetical protein VND41_04240 [Nitrososphaerales archaeon]|nr:hypothetical protein [Nitrososphaerales archaeon]